MLESYALLARRQGKRLTVRDLQIEQGLTIRRQHGDAIAAAVAGVYAWRLRRPLTV